MDADVIDIMEYLLNNTPKTLVNNAVKRGDTEGFIVDLNTRGQLGFYENAKGEKLADIGGEYSFITREIKNLGAREVNLNDTGKYWGSYEINPIDENEFEIDSNPIKDEDNLEDRYGNNLEGLNKKHTKLANDFIENKIWEEAERNL